MTPVEAFLGPCRVELHKLSRGRVEPEFCVVRVAVLPPYPPLFTMLPVNSLVSALKELVGMGGHLAARYGSGLGMSSFPCASCGYIEYTVSPLCS